MQTQRADASVVTGIVLSALLGAVAPQPASANPPAAVVAISGHFALATPDGRKVTDANYRGKWLVVYFGYTSCPDVCPTVILRIGQALESLGAGADRIQPIFITVDPQRDTPERLTHYLASFNPRVVGLRGDPQQTEDAARQFHVYYRTRSFGNGEYSVDHSSFLYVINPDGRFTKLLPDTLSADQLASELTTLTSPKQVRGVTR